MGLSGYQTFDAVGVGIGPFNLSVATLAHPIKELRTRFFDRKPEFQWHPGLLFPDATIQVSFLKDLVTLADPTSPYSFLAFLATTKRLYRFINADYSRVTRREFNQYMQWASRLLPELEFGRAVHAISLESDTLVVHLDDEKVRARNLIVGTGPVPYVPDCARRHLCSTVFHAATYLEMFLYVSGKRVAVIGGGQTGAEVVAHLLGDSSRLPRELTWVSRRPNFLPLDESPFTNELFTPAYSNYFFGLNPQARRTLLQEQKLASDGISNELLGHIYRRLYELEFLESRSCTCSLYAGCEMRDLCREDGNWRVDIYDPLSGRSELLLADLVILCTGYRNEAPPCLEPLAGRISRADGELSIRMDYSLEWDGPTSLRIYLQNAARRSRGIADPNLSLMAWRSATIVNSVVGGPVYDTSEESSALSFPVEEIEERRGGLSR